MSKAWKIIAIIAVVALILGVLLILVGMVTGGDAQRVKDVFSATYNIEEKLNAFKALMGMAK